MQKEKEKQFMTERENNELKQKQDDEILQEINGEQKVEYGLLSALLYIPEEERQKMKNIAKSC